MLIQWFPIFAFGFLILFSCAILYHLARTYSASYTTQIDLWELPESELRPTVSKTGRSEACYVESYFEEEEEEDYDDDDSSEGPINYETMRPELREAFSRRKPKVSISVKRSNEDDDDDSCEGLINYGTMKPEPRKKNSAQELEASTSKEADSKDTTIVHPLERSPTPEHTPIPPYDTSAVPIVFSNISGHDIVAQDFAYTPKLQFKLPVPQPSQSPTPATNSATKKPADSAFYKEVKKSLRRTVRERTNEDDSEVSESATALLNRDTEDISSWLSPTREEIRKGMELEEQRGQ